MIFYVFAPHQLTFLFFLVFFTMEEKKELELTLELKMFRCEVILYGVKRRGIRGAAHKIASKHGASRLSTREFTIVYGDSPGTEDNLYFDVLFSSLSDRVHFEVEISEIHKLIPSVAGRVSEYPKVDLEGSVVSVKESLLKTILPGDFAVHSPPGSVVFDAPVQNLGDYKLDEQCTSKSSFKSESSAKSSERSSKRSKRVSSKSSEMSSERSSKRSKRVSSMSNGKWQSIEEPKWGHYKPYDCHLIPQTWPEWAKNPNNIIAASWKFHQDLDGLNVLGRIPSFVLEFVGDANEEVEADDGPRFKVDVRVRFRSKELGEHLKETISWKDDIYIEGDNLRTYVHVKSIKDFRTCVETKRLVTENAWGIC